MPDFDPIAAGAIPRDPGAVPFDPIKAGAVRKVQNLGIPGGVQSSVDTYDPQTLQLGPFDTGIGLSGEANNALIKLGRGALDLPQGVKQALLNVGDKLDGTNRGDEYAAANNADIGLYDQGRANAGETGTDWLRGLGHAIDPISLIPGAGTSRLATMGLGALAGGTDGLLSYDPENKLSNRLIHAGEGGVLGAIAAPIAQTLTGGLVKGAQLVANSGRSVAQRLGEVLGSRANPETIAATSAGSVWNDLPKEAQQGLIDDVRASLAGDTFDPEAVARKANLIENGLTPTAASVTRTPRDWTIERNLQKLGVSSQDPELAAIGGTLTDTYQGNNNALLKRLQDIRGLFPGGNKESQGSAVVSGLNDLAESTQKDVGEVYKAVRETHGEKLASDARNVTGLLQNPDIADNAYAEPILNSVTKRLKRFGMIDTDGAPTAETMTVTQADEFRKFLQTLKVGDPKTDRIVTAFIKATDADVLSGAGEDFMSVARTAAQKRFALLNNPATQRAINADPLTQGKIEQQFINTNVVNASERDLGTLMDTLNEIKDPGKRQAALDALRAGVLEHLQNAGTDVNAGAFKAKKFADEMTNKLGPNKIRMIFGPENSSMTDAFGKATDVPSATDQLLSLSRAGLDSSYEPGLAAVNHSNTAPTVLNLVQKARMIPFVPAVVTENVEKAAARRGYAGQLADVLQSSTNVTPQKQDAARTYIAAELAKILRPGQVAAQALDNRPQQSSN